MVANAISVVANARTVVANAISVVANAISVVANDISVIAMIYWWLLSKTILFINYLDDSERQELRIK